jgi:hypothetical protein
MSFIASIKLSQMAISWRGNWRAQLLAAPNDHAEPRLPILNRREPQALFSTGKNSKVTAIRHHLLDQLIADAEPFRLLKSDRTQCRAKSVPNFLEASEKST